jgi:mercuric ion transport protein
VTRTVERLRRALPTSLGSLAGVACVACCAVPLLVAAGVLGGTGWAGAARFMPGVAVGLAVLAGLTWWWGARRRIHAAGCASGACSCPGS